MTWIQQIQPLTGALRDALVVDVAHHSDAFALQDNAFDLQPAAARPPGLNVAKVGQQGPYAGRGRLNVDLCKKLRHALSLLDDAG